MTDKEILGEATFSKKITRIGNSKGVIIPDDIVEEMHLETGTRVNVHISRARTVMIDQGD